MRCQRCGAEDPADHRFCGDCGAPMTVPSGRRNGSRERKQVTVLFADVVGFTSLSERFDAEAVQEIMEGCFDVLAREITRYEGTVNAFTGDGVMALFGAPLTHEDHARRGALAALRIQERMADYTEIVRERWDVPFLMRLGLNTGLVVVGDLGEQMRIEYTALGDTVNVAARLEAAAPAGAIWAGEATYRAAGDVFTWRPVGNVAVKGKADPVPAYELTGHSAAHGPTGGPAQRGLTRLVGRGRELQQLLGAWEEARRGRGQVVSVVGEAGLGKSRLLHEFARHLAAQQERYCEASCSSYGEGISYWPFVTVLRHVLDLEDGSSGEVKRRIDKALAAWSPDAGSSAPYLQHVLGLPVDDEVFGRLPPDVVRQRTVETLTRVLLTVGASEPLALVLEDVHWIDKASEEVVAAIVEAMAATPLLLILAYRPEYLRPWAGTGQTDIVLTRLPGAGCAQMVEAILDKSYAARVLLEQLTSEQSRTMVRHLLDTNAVPAELEALVARETDGNPLFIEELTRSLIEAGDLVRRGGRYVFARPPDSLVVPLTVEGVLLARVDRLPPPLKELLQTASVLGRAFSRRLLSAVVGIDDLDRQLIELEDLDFVYPSAPGPEPEYAFKHILTQEAVYRTLLRRRREDLHERAGRALETLYPDRLGEFAEILAHHYAHSANDDRAVEYLDLANRKATRANAVEEAKALFDAAMDRLDRMPDTPTNRHRRITLLTNQFLVFWKLYRIPEYFELAKGFEPVASQIDDLGLLGAYYQNIGHCQWVFGEFAEALQTLERAADAAVAGGNLMAAGSAYCLTAWCHLSLGNHEHVAHWSARALLAFRHQFDLQFCMWARTGAGFAYAQSGRWRKAERECLSALAMGDRYGDPSVACFSNFVLSLVYANQGDLQRAVSHGELAVSEAPTPADSVWAETGLALALCRAGEPDRAAASLAKLVPLYEATRFRWGGVINAVCLGEAYWRAGRLGEARETLQGAATCAERHGMRLLLASAHRLLGEVTAELDPTPDGWAEAARHFQQSVTMLDDMHADNELAHAHAGYGRLRQRTGDREGAGVHLARAREIFDRLGNGRESERVRATRGRHSAQRGRESVAGNA